MTIDKDELDQIVDELEVERIIRSSLYCGRCGYNLRSLPHVYTCPECGNPYNARPLKMEGIFLPHTAYIPVGDIIAVLFCGLVGGVLIIAGLVDPNPPTAVVGLLFAGLGLSLAVQAYRRLMGYVKFRAVYKRIIREEEEEQD